MEIRDGRGVRRSSLSDSSLHTAHADSPKSPARAHGSPNSDDGGMTFSTPESSPAKAPSKAIVPVSTCTGASWHQRSNSKQIVSKREEHRSVSRPLDQRRIPVLQQEQVKPMMHQPIQPSTAVPAVVSGAVVHSDTAHVVAPIVPARGETAAVRKVNLTEEVRAEIPDGVEGDGQSERAMNSIIRRSVMEKMIRRTALGFRFSEFALCLISFSTMAADRIQGWNGDSYDRYVEYRYCVSVNVVAFVYSGFQAVDLTYHLMKGKHFVRHRLRCHFTFFLDQVLSYLLMSAASSAATRVDDWQSNWGEDEFTKMASSSVSMAFLAFASFALSSLISGFDLCTRRLS